MMQNKDIWIFAEVHNGIVEPTTFQLITKAKEISNNKKVVTILLERLDQNLEEEIKKYGPDEIIIVKNNNTKSLSDNQIASVIYKLTKDNMPNSILFPATVIGRSVSARLQAKLQTGLTADCLDLKFEGNLLIQTKPSYGDNIMCEIVCPDTFPQMASVRPNIFDAKINYNKNLIINTIIDMEIEKKYAIKINEEIPLLSKSDSIKNASRVIAIGRGSSDKKTIELINTLSNKLGAKIGVTRPLTDLKPFTVDDQIGQSGNTIKPKLLINLGIHGAAQYTTGITNSEIIISINNNKNAPIFNVSDYMYIGDATEFITELLKIMQ